MKKVLYILNDGVRKFTYARTAGLYRAIQNADEPMELYIVRGDGYSDFAEAHNCGEYNIFRLPDYSQFDGIFLDVNSNFNADTNSFGSKGVTYAIQAAAASGKPVISMANRIDGFYYVGIDNYEAMMSMIRYMHQTMGLSDFWFAMGPEDNYENQARTQALLDYCVEHNLPREADRFYAESYILECGVHAFKKLYARHGSLPQAIICANDHIAVGICQAAAEAGYQVPRDFLVTGFDNVDLSAYLTPSITTVDQMSWTMGDACVDTMLRIWRGEDVPQENRTATQLVLRESTGHPTPEKIDMKNRVAEFISRDTSATEFSYKLSALQYQLPGCDSIEEICQALTQCVSALDCKGLYLVLDRELYEYGSQFDFNERTTRVNATTDKLLTEGYPKSMELVYAWEKGKAPTFPHREAGGILDPARPRGNCENFLFVPLHFMEYTVGFLAIWDCIEMMRLRCVSSIVNTLTMAMRSYFASSKLAYVNRMLSGISMKDDLTGLYNRLGYHNLAPRLFKRTQDSGRRLGILFIDMDRMKFFNDNYGHACGDRAILSISNAIMRSVPEDAIPVRYGGDEFLVLAPADGQESVHRMIDAIASAIPEEAKALDMPYAPGISTGFVLTDPTTAETLEEYVEEADSLMYEDKKQRGASRN